MIGGLGGAGVAAIGQDDFEPFEGTFGIMSLADSHHVSGDIDSKSVSLRESDRLHHNTDERRVLTDGVTSSSAGRTWSSTSWLCCLDIESLQTLWNVSSSEVARKLFAAMFPVTKAVEEEESDFRSNPDLYGPFWIATTVSLLLFITTNVDILLGKTGVETDYKFFVIVAGLVYGCLVGVPLILGCLFYFITRNSSLPFTNLRLLASLYGYSLIVLLPVSLLCLIPFTVAKWVAVVAGFTVSVVFMWRNLRRDIGASIPHNPYLPFAILCVIQLVVFLTFGMGVLKSQTSLASSDQK